MLSLLKPRMGPFWQRGHNLNNLVEGLLDDTKYQITRLNAKKICMRSLYKPMKNM